MNAELIGQYRLLHEGRPDYGAGASHVERIAEVIAMRGVRSVLDFGCGKGVLVERLRRRFPEVVVDGYDPAIRGRDEIPRERYEMVIANDVLEHLDPDGYEGDLLEMRRLDPRWVFFNISCRPAVNVLPDGRNCHTLVRRPEWWRETLRAHFPGYLEHASEWCERSKGWMVILTKGPELEGRRVAIVGNAPQAMENREAIDGFDCVIRFNEFVVGSGHEAVGMRTDVLAIPACHEAVITRRLQRFTADTRYVLDLATAGGERAKANHGKIRGLLPHATIIDAGHVTGALCEELCEGIPGASPTGSGRLIPSTGISAIAWAMVSGAGEIYLTGFSFEGRAAGHYFAPGHGMSPCHDLVRELRWLAERREHPGLRYDAHIGRRVELWCEVSARLGSAEDAYRSFFI